MKVLIACEFSGIVREAFKEKGHDAWSCDLLPTEGNPNWHIQGDVLEILNQGWDLMIAHPPCTFLANSGIQHLYIGRKPIKDEFGSIININSERWQKMIEGANFFKKIFNAPISKIAIENPVQHKFAKMQIGVEYNQIVQPYYFGEEAQKKTCLWLKNLPFLQPTNIVGQGKKYVRNGKSNGSAWYQLPPSEDRWKHRSRTFQSIANTMAEQWGNL